MIHETVILHLIFGLSARSFSSSSLNFVLLPPIILFDIKTFRKHKLYLSSHIDTDSFETFWFHIAVSFMI